MSIIDQWRQGAFLTAEHKKIGFSGEARYPVFIVSHSCDIKRGRFVECMWGTELNELDPQKMHAQNPRDLHIELINNGAKKYLALTQRDKFEIKTETFEKFSPEKSLSLDDDGLKILQKWLSLKYRRSAFPDALNERIAEVMKGKPLKKSLKKPNNILGIYLSYKPETDIPISEWYEVNMVIVYRTADPLDLSAVSEVETYFRQRVELLAKENIFLTINIRSDKEFTLHDLMTHDQWYYDNFSMYLSPVGETAD